ncbi:glycosyltransferase [Salinibacterium sp. M195]|uniref:glycosyltransferase n=1 Tax=Salinibacterium sp. M195 TaxID=2583374 RepID=UPI001C62D2FE|nr:glycosyltransferase [Salinibacterium sp. M195]QYH35609.1 glycosyltransferase family 4 protein [Salinibacterium sp. M195]
MTSRRILLISYSNLKDDPRVRRQIDWLSADGWSIDTLGLGEHPASAADSHYALLPQAPWVRARWGSFLVYGALPSQAKFRYLMLDRIPQELLSAIASGAYDCIVFEDYDFLPLLTLRKVFTGAALAKQIHLDMHEYRDPQLELNSIRRMLTDRYYRWRRSLIGHSAIDTRTTVASRIAELYVDDFGVTLPEIVRNSPPREDLTPSEVSDDNIQLVFHGMASWARGFQEIFAALPTIDKRFSFTFMLTGNPTLIAQVKELARPFGERVSFVDPVPMTEVPSRINEFDLEVIFYQPTAVNLEFSLPNKLFEAIQSRMGVVIGQSPMMAQIVNEFGVGVIVPGWSAADLAATINGLTAAKVRELKNASHLAADALSAETEGAAFIAALGRYPDATNSSPEHSR